MIVSSIVQPAITLIDELSYRLLGWQRLDWLERLDIESHTTADVIWHFANWAWLLAFIYLQPKGWI